MGYTGTERPVSCFPRESITGTEAFSYQSLKPGWSGGCFTAKLQQNPSVSGCRGGYKRQPLKIPMHPNPQISNSQILDSQMSFIFRCHCSVLGNGSFLWIRASMPSRLDCRFLHLVLQLEQRCDACICGTRCSVTPRVGCIIGLGSS